MLVLHGELSQYHVFTRISSVVPEIEMRNKKNQRKIFLASLILRSNSFEKVGTNSDQLLM